MLHPAHRRRRLLNRLKTAVGVVLAIAVCGLAVVFALGKAGFIDLPKADGGTGAAPQYVPLPENAFEGTPAADWKGFDALVWPKAAPTGHFSRKQVERALKDVEDALWAGRVDWPQGKTDHGKFQGLFAPALREEVGERLDSDDRAGFASELAPGRALAAEPRVSGTVTVDETELGEVRVLRVRTQLVWAYGFQGDLLNYGDHLVLVNIEQEWLFADSDEVRAEDAGMRFGEMRWLLYGMDCDQAAKGLLAPGAAGDGVRDESDEEAWRPGTDLNAFGDDCAKG